MNVLLNFLCTAEAEHVIQNDLLTPVIEEQERCGDDVESVIQKVHYDHIEGMDDKVFDDDDDDLTPVAVKKGLVQLFLSSDQLHIHAGGLMCVVQCDTIVTPIFPRLIRAGVANLFSVACQYSDI